MAWPRDAYVGQKPLKENPTMNALSEDRQDVVMNALCHEARMQTAHYHAIIAEPFARLRPAVYIDGDQWCALYGENLQDGVAGFGSSPAEAEQAFNKAWGEHLSGVKQHTHVAGTTVGKPIDTCAKCGRDLRNPIHTRLKE